MLGGDQKELTSVDTFLIRVGKPFKRNQRHSRARNNHPLNARLFTRSFKHRVRDVDSRLHDIAFIITGLHFTHQSHASSCTSYYPSHKENETYLNSQRRSQMQNARHAFQERDEGFALSQVWNDDELYMVGVWEDAWMGFEFGDLGGGADDSADVVACFESEEGGFEADEAGYSCDLKDISIWVSLTKRSYCTKYRLEPTRKPLMRFEIERDL